MRTINLALLVASALAQVSTSAVNWPQFRGPDACGVDSSKPAPIRWNLNRGENVQWQTEIPGLAHSSPILWDDRIYVTTAVQKDKADLKVGLYGSIDPVANDQPQQWRLIAVDKKSGKILWNTLAQETLPRVSRHPKATHCNSTPATEGHRIVTIFGSEGLFCFDMDGKLMWKKSLGPMDSGYYVVPTAQWGFASSPVIHDGRIVVLCDVQTNSFIACFDILNGIELWRTQRKDVPTWGTPTIARVGSQTQILVNGWHRTGAYDFSNGKEVWNLNGGGDIPVPTPIVAGDFAYFTSGHGPQGRPIRAIELQAKGDITPAKGNAKSEGIAWVQPRLGNYMQTPLVVRNNLYACYDTGVLTCLDATTGNVHYSERLGTGSEGFTSSPISDGRNVFIASENGNVYVVPASTKFSVIATNRMNETCMATPLISDGMLCYRTREKLVALSDALAR